MFSSYPIFAQKVYICKLIYRKLLVSILTNYILMKKVTLKQALYEQPSVEMVDLVAETSLMVTSSGIEEGEYEEENEW